MVSLKTYYKFCMHVLNFIQKSKRNHNRDCDFPSDSVSISRFSQLFGIRKEAITLQLNPATKTISEFSWGPGNGTSYADAYTRWLSDFVKIPEEMELYYASSKNNLLTTSPDGKRRLKGNTNIAIIQ